MTFDCLQKRNDNAPFRASPPPCVLAFPPPFPVSQPDSAMKAARYYGPGDVRVESIPEPQVKPGQVLLKVRALLLRRQRRSL